jgi:hypothetical protein
VRLAIENEEPLMGDEAVRMPRVDERALPEIDIQQETRRRLEAIGYF